MDQITVSRRGKTFKVDKNELLMGIKVEMEHTDNPEISKKIAIDHLAENPKYYTKLKAAHIDNDLEEQLLKLILQEIKLRKRLDLTKK